MTNQPPKCIGIWGWLFGHKYVKVLFLAGQMLTSDCCYRCGAPRGSSR